jgi:hypothetical protein
MATLVEKWDIFELALPADPPGNPFLEASLTAEFNHQQGRARVEGFYDGEGVFKIRFMPGLEGEWQFVAHSNLAALDGQRGSFTCTPASAGNHGPVRVVDAGHFAYADGRPYHPVGTTCYVWNHQGPALAARTLKTLEGAPFNKLRMCVFPKRYAYNQNEPPDYPFPGQPGAWDFSRFNPAYFQRLEQHLLALCSLGIEADLIVFHPYDGGAWGFDRLPAEVNTRYLHYLVARLAAFRNLWWSLANEYDLMFGRSLPDWDGYFQLIQSLDPYDHPRSIHNCVGFYDHRQPWVTHCSIQHHDLRRVQGWLRQYGKPVVVDECGYEGDINRHWGDLSAEELVLRCWLGFTVGGYVGHGETLMNDEQALWWSKGGELRGESAARLAFLRGVFEAVPPPGLFPLDALPGEALESAGQLFSPDASGPYSRILAEGPRSVEAAGHNGTDYYLFYFGMHQPGWRVFNLPEGRFNIDLLDTWGMTIERLAEATAGTRRVELPRKKYLAIRVQRV